MRADNSDLEGLREYATPRQTEQLEAVLRNDTMQAAADELNITLRNLFAGIQRLRKNAAKEGHGTPEEVPPGYALKGTSTLYKDGKTSLVWVKTCQDAEQMAAVMEAYVETLADLVKPAEPVEPIEFAYEPDLMVAVVEGDPHSGSYGRKQYGGDDWDIKEFEKVNKAAMSSLVSSLPYAHTALLVDLGDLIHDPSAGKGQTNSGNQLDCDGLFWESVEAAIRVKIYTIQLMLSRFPAVVVRIANGNHDGRAAGYISRILEAFYRNEDRVTVVRNDTAFWYYQHGKTAIGVSHGDTVRKGADYPLLMANDQPQLWGETECRYWLLGHVHHKDVKDYPGCRVEYFPTLAGKDNYHHSAGYRAPREITAMVYSAEYGEVGRHTCSLNRALQIHS